MSKFDTFVPYNPGSSGVSNVDTFKAPEETILQEAQRLVHGDRRASYGHPIEDYTATGRIWSAILERWMHNTGIIPRTQRLPDIDPRIATLMMVGLKASREAHQHKRDNLTDAAGYAECTSMIADRQQEQMPG